MKLFFFLCLLVAIKADQIYQNSADICKRCTCTKSDDAQIFTLDCANQNFTHILATWPEHNATLRATFSGNNLTTLQRLPPTDAVVEVVFSNCGIQFIYPGIFEASINTKFVDLSHNLLTSEEVSSDRFRGPYEGNHAETIALEHLDLSYNQIHTLYKNVFEFLPHLKRLNLEGNDFVVLDVHTQLALAKVPGLLSLNLANNELTELIAGAIESFKGLVELDLSRNDLDFVPTSLANVGHSLEVLILDDNPIIELVAKTFSGLDHLIQISANNLTELKLVGTGTFATAPKLTKLSLSNNSLLQAIDPYAFSPNQTIKELYLCHNNLTRLPYILLQWSELDTLDITNNPFDCNCDLYNITNALSPDITRNEEGPTCMHPTTLRPIQVYFLKSDICTAKPRTGKRILRHHFSVPLAGLIVMLTIGLFVAIGLAWSRYRRFVRGADPYATQVLYSPLLTHNARV